MPLTIAPTAQHDITRNSLRSQVDLESFGSQLMSCCAESKELFDLVNISVNFDNLVQKYERNDFLNPIDGLVFSGMQAFAQCWVTGNPWPANAVEWTMAVVPHFDFFFSKNPDFPQVYKVEAAKRLCTMPASRMGDFDRVCDGLIDYLTGVRYHLLDARSKHLDPAKRKEEYEKVTRSIRIPGGQVEASSPQEVLAQIFALPAATKPFYTGVRGFDHYYGARALGGDAWLFFAGTGGGKTNAACQAAAYTAAAGKLVLYVTTEVKAPILLYRMCAAHTSTPYNTLKGITGTPGHANARMFSDWMLTGPGSRITIMDYRTVAGGNYKEKFMRILDSFYRLHGSAPDFMVWDWIGKAVGDTCTTSWEKREAYNGVANMMSEKTDELDNTSITLAQASAEVKNKSNLNDTDTADSKSLAHSMEGVCGMTTMQDTSENNAQEKESFKLHQYWVICKCREELALKLPVARRFDLARFETTT